MQELFFREFVTSLIMHSVPAEILKIEAQPQAQIFQQIQMPRMLAAPSQFIPLALPPVPAYAPETIPLPLTQQILPSMLKLNFLVADPSVSSIECPGPNKPLLVNKGGMIQATNILLTKDEVDNIIREFSEKTRIPLIQGTFKAVFGRLLVTAVISEFVGTRFIIQKRMQGY